MDGFAINAHLLGHQPATSSAFGLRGCRVRALLAWQP
jgi:hypothetical protein